MDWILWIVNWHPGLFELAGLALLTLLMLVMLRIVTELKRKND